jgi:hypothetical protein
MLFIGCTDTVVEDVKSALSKDSPVSTQLTEGRLGLHWGMTVSEAKQHVPLGGYLPAPEPDDIYYPLTPFNYEESYPGFAATVIPFFLNDSLYRIVVYYRVPFESQYVAPELVASQWKLLETMLLNEFGRPKEAENVEPDNDYSAVQRIRFGEGRFYRRWTTTESTVELELKCSSCSDGKPDAFLAVVETRTSRLLYPRFEIRATELVMANFHKARANSSGTK